MIQEYRNLPLYNEEFEDIYKNLFEKASKLLEKIPNFGRISKTRNANNERLTIEKGYKIFQEIIKIEVTCEEFEEFLRLYEKTR
jgi:hypothetical protein